MGGRIVIRSLVGGLALLLAACTPSPSQKPADPVPSVRSFLWPPDKTHTPPPKVEPVVPKLDCPDAVKLVPVVPKPKPEPKAKRRKAEPRKKVRAVSQPTLPVGPTAAERAQRRADATEVTVLGRRLSCTTVRRYAGKTRKEREAQRVRYGVDSATGATVERTCF